MRDRACGASRSGAAGQVFDGHAPQGLFGGGILLQVVDVAPGQCVRLGDREILGLGDERLAGQACHRDVFALHHHGCIQCPGPSSRS